MAQDKPKLVIHFSSSTSRVSSVPFENACPKCEGNLQSGYGLAYGGFGPYQFCESCDWATKHPEPEEE